jgi:hypothetical protein
MKSYEEESDSDDEEDYNEEQIRVIERNFRTNRNQNLRNQLIVIKRSCHICNENFYKSSHYNRHIDSHHFSLNISK